MAKRLNILSEFKDKCKRRVLGKDFCETNNKET